MSNKKRATAIWWLFLQQRFGVKLENSFYQRYEYSPEFNYANGRWSK